MSKGQERHLAPKLTGLSLADAKASLAAATLEPGAVTRAHSETVRTGVVISTGTRAGTRLRRGTAVDLKAATATMRTSGFVVRTRPVSGINNLGLGVVSYADPPSASKARKGATVTLYYV